MKFLLLLILLSTSAYSGTILDCYSASRPQINGSFEREKLSASTRKELRPFYHELNRLNQKGAEIRAVEARYRELNAIKFPKKEVVDEMHDLDMKYTFLSQEMTVINNNFVDKVQEIYKKKGIPAIVVTDDSGVKILQLDFTRKPRDSRAFEFYRRVSERFGLKKITMSVKDNAQKSFMGYFSPSESRIEMGAEQAVSILQEYINSTGKHESRHAMFFARRNRGAPSIFHTQFHATGSKLLNEQGLYERYMSAEELYTFSTDLQTLAQAFKGKFLTDATMQRSLLRQIAETGDSLKVISDATSEFTGSMINSLTDQLSGKKPIGIQLFPQPNGNVQVQLKDEFNRMATVTLVSEADKKAFVEMQNLSVLRNQAMETEFPQYLTSKGIVPAEFTRKMQADQLTLEEQAIMGNYQKEFELTPTGVRFEQDAERVAKKVIITAKVRLENIRKVAEFQSQEVGRLAPLMGELIKHPTPENIQLVRHKLFEMAKNVKEDYKGFILKN